MTCGGYDLSKYTVFTSFVGIAVHTKFVGMRSGGGQWVGVVGGGDGVEKLRLKLTSINLEVRIEAELDNMSKPH